MVWRGGLDWTGWRGLERLVKVIEVGWVWRGWLGLDRLIWQKDWMVVWVWRGLLGLERLVRDGKFG